MFVLNDSFIRKLIDDGESETVEFKESFNDEAIKSIGAFFNANGGVVLIGVSDDKRVKGFNIGKKTLEDIANRIQDATEPRVQPSYSVIHINAVTVLAIQIQKSIGAPISVRGRYFKRSGKTDQRMSHEEIMQCIINGSGMSWDAHIEPNTTLSDLDIGLIRKFVEVANKLGRRIIPEEAPPEQVLRKMELMKKDGITRAGILLFGKNPTSFYPSAFLKIGRFRSPTTIVDERELHGSLLTQLDNAMMWFRDRLSTEFIMEGKAQRDVRWEYPLNAIREAVINMLSHRDFLQNSHSQIRLYDDRLECWNAGALPSSLTPELLFQDHDSIPRNRKIAEVFYNMGLVERWGSGTLRIAEELKASSLPQPDFISVAGRFKLIFYKERITTQLSSEFNLTERQFKVLTYIKEKGSVTNLELQEIASISKRTASRELSNMMNKGCIISVGGERGRGKRYLLKE